jgi:hypothetical protein
VGDGRGVGGVIGRALLPQGKPKTLNINI